jgi:hypothetical protein
MQQQRCADDFHGLHLRVASIERDIEQFKTAFPRDDVGAVDYRGHRDYHSERIASSKLLDEYKQGVTKKIVFGAVGLVFTVLGFIAGPALLRWLQ